VTAPSPARRLAALVVALGLPLAAAGCTASGPGPDASVDPNAPGPLDALLGISSYGGVSAQQYVEQVTTQENAIAACMREQGFEYSPRVPAVADVTMSVGPVRGTLEFAEEGGYGVWTSVHEGGALSWSLEVDPNWASRQAMGDEERAAYDDALGGPVVERSADDSVLREGGCTDQARADPLSSTDQALQAIQDEVIAFQETRDDAAQFAALDAEWSSCMSDEGYRFTSPHAAEQSFQAAAADWYAADPPVPPDDLADRADVERATAVADWHCREGISYAARHKVIADQVEQEFIDTHRAELDALVAAPEPTP